MKLATITKPRVIDLLTLGISFYPLECAYSIYGYNSDIRAIIPLSAKENGSRKVIYFPSRTKENLFSELLNMQCIGYGHTHPYKEDEVLQLGLSETDKITVVDYGGLELLCCLRETKLSKGIEINNTTGGYVTGRVGCFDFNISTYTPRDEKVERVRLVMR